MGSLGRVRPTCLLLSCTLALALFGASRVLAVTDNPQAQAALDNAQATWDREENDKALQLFEGVVNDFPDTEQGTMALAMVGLWWKEAGDKAKALETWNSIVWQYPGSVGNAEAWALMGGTAEQDGDYPNAVAYWRRVVTNFPGTWQEARARFWRAGVQCRARERYQEAIADYERVLVVAPDDPMAVQSKLLIGANYLWLHEPGTALGCYDRVVSEHAGTQEAVEALYYRGYCKAVTADPAGAVGDLTEAARTASDPGIAVRALHVLANCQARLGRYDEARATLQEVLADSSPAFRLFHPSTLYFIGHTYFAQGRYAEAEQWLRRVLTEYPGDICAPDAQELLGRVAGRR